MRRSFVAPPSARHNPDVRQTREVSLFEGIAFFALAFGAYALLSALLSAPVWYFCRHRVRWAKSDVAVVYAPWVVWFAVSNFRPKSLANVLLESLILACSAPLAGIVHIAFRGHLSPRAAACFGLALVATVGLGLARFVWASPDLVDTI